MTLLQDVRFACRVLWKNPTFTFVAMVSLAIGIGANSAIFSLADALLLRPLPVPRPGEVVTVGTIQTFGQFNSINSSYRDYVDFRDQSKSFDGLAAFTDVTVGFATRRDTLPQLKMGTVTTGNMLRVMGVEPELGRSFRRDEDQVPGRDAVIILGHGMWEKDFADHKKCDWKPGAVIVPPEDWFHEHFNTGAQPARYLALRYSGLKHRQPVSSKRGEDGSEDCECWERDQQPVPDAEGHAHADDCPQRAEHDRETGDAEPAKRILPRHPEPARLRAGGENHRVAEKDIARIAGRDEGPAPEVE